jgi:excisionase family DNA binding protein
MTAQELEMAKNEILFAIKPILTTTEAAQYLGVSLQFIYKLTHARKIRYFKSEGGKMNFFRREDLDAWALAYRVMTDKELNEEAQGR